MSKDSTRGRSRRRAMAQARMAPPAGPDSTRRIGKRTAVSTVVQTAAGDHQQQRAAQARGGETAAPGGAGSPPSAAARRRWHRRWRCARTRGSPGTPRSDSVTVTCGSRSAMLADAALVRRVGVGVEEAHGDAGHLLPGQHVDGRVHAVHRRGPSSTGRRRHSPAPAPRCAAGAAPAAAGRSHVDVVLLEAVLVGHLHRIAEALGDQQRGVRALALDDGVGGERGAVDHHARPRPAPPRRAASASAMPCSTPCSGACDVVSTLAVQVSARAPGRRR